MASNAHLPILVHYHIFKNAGSSIDFLLKESFGSNWRTFEGTDAHDVVNAHQLGSFLKATQGIRAVSSHLSRPPLPFSSCRPLIFLRDPILRAKSVFRFVYKDTSQPNSQIARERGFKGYVEWALADADQGGVVIKNYQTVHLSPASFCPGGILKAHASRADYELAKEFITTTGPCGIVEEFEQSMEMYLRRYGIEFPELRIKGVWRNRTQAEGLSLEQQIDEIRLELGSSLFDRLVDANSLDQQLYDHAKNQLIADGGQ